MASQTAGIQQLLAAEKRAAEKINEARKKKAQRLRQAKQEAQAEIDKYRQVGFISRFTFIHNCLRNVNVRSRTTNNNTWELKRISKPKFVVIQKPHCQKCNVALLPTNNKSLSVCCNWSVISALNFIIILFSKRTWRRDNIIKVMGK